MKILEVSCTNSYLYVYVGVSCDVVTGPGYYSATCTALYDLYITTFCFDGGGGDPSPGIGDEGFPPPDANGGGTNVSPFIVPLQIKQDSLKKHFPCASALIIAKLLSDPAYFDFVAAFTTTQKPDLIWQDAALPWMINNKYQTRLSSPNTSPNSTSDTITLNTLALQNSSQLLIAATAIHETIHAYINSNIKTATINQINGYSDLGTWFIWH